jgi:hypothetical protein
LEEVASLGEKSWRERLHVTTEKQGKSIIRKFPAKVSLSLNRSKRLTEARLRIEQARTRHRTNFLPCRRRRS